MLQRTWMFYWNLSTWSQRCHFSSDSFTTTFRYKKHTFANCATSRPKYLKTGICIMCNFTLSLLYWHFLSLCAVVSSANSEHASLLELHGTHPPSCDACATMILRQINKLWSAAMKLALFIPMPVLRSLAQKEGLVRLRSWSLPRWPFRLACWRAEHRWHTSLPEVRPIVQLVEAVVRKVQWAQLGPSTELPVSAGQLLHPCLEEFRIIQWEPVII